MKCTNSKNLTVYKAKISEITCYLNNCKRSNYDTLQTETLVSGVLIGKRSDGDLCSSNP